MTQISASLYVNDGLEYSCNITQKIPKTLAIDSREKLAGILVKNFLTFQRTSREKSKYLCDGQKKSLSQYLGRKTKKIQRKLKTENITTKTI